MILMKKFEDCIPEIDEAIQKQRGKWTLNAINWIDFDDISQIIRIHIHKKWHMWDQSRPLAPWLSTVINHQIKNQVRNHYGNYVKPCNNCPFSLGADGCSATASKLQDTQCTEYEKWSKKKKNALELKTALSTEHHEHEINQRQCQAFNYDDPMVKLDEFMARELSAKNYKAYRMMFFDQSSEEEIALYMGYKTNEKNRAPGYRQVKNLRKAFEAKAREGLETLDILYGSDE